jgi:D-glycero-D-manno-heptose 1,7-bisphosphate phosphatase
MNRAIIFDRDGVLNELVKRPDGQVTSPWNVDEFRFTPGAKDACRLAKSLGYKTFVVTNQPGIKDGDMTDKDLELINRMVQRWLNIDLIVCAYDRKSDYYKPNNRSVEMLINKYDIDRQYCYMIGDRWKDIVCGERSGIITIFVGGHYSSPKQYNHIHPHVICNDVLEAVKQIEEFG